MNTTKNANRLEKLRKARSLNDVVSVMKDIGKDLMASRTAVKKIEASARRSAGVQRISISATAPKKSIRIGGFSEIETEQVKLQNVDDPAFRKETKQKKENKVKITKRPKSAGIALKDTKYVAPTLGSAEKIQNSVDVIHDLHDNLVELDAAREKIIQQFKNAKSYAVAMR